MEVVFGFVMEVPRPCFLSAVDLESTWGVWETCQWCLSGHRSCRKGAEWHDMHIRPGPLQSPWSSMLVGLQRLRLGFTKQK